MRISDWSSDVCSSDLGFPTIFVRAGSRSMPCSSMFSCGAATAVSMGRRARRPSRPEAAILVILENTSGTGWLLLTIAHARNDGPLRYGSGVMSLGVSSGDLIGSWRLGFSDIAFVTGKAGEGRLN